MSQAQNPWEGVFEVRETEPGNAEVVDKRTGKVVAFGATGFMHFHAKTLWEIERDTADDTPTISR